MSRPLKLFLVAAEESGDVLGGALMGALRALRPDVSFARRRRTGDAKPRPQQPVRYRGSVDHRRRLDSRKAAADLPAHPRNRRRGDCRAAGRARHHRQSGFHASRGAARAQERAGYPDLQLRAADGVGVAPMARARDARLRRSSAGDPAVRTGGIRSPRGSALYLCRPSARRTDRRAAPQRGRGAPPHVRPADPARSCRGAGRAKFAGLPASSAMRSRNWRSRRGRSMWCCRRFRILPHR